MNQQQPDKPENQESQPSDIDILIQEINIHCNPKSSYYGQLVKWKSGEEWFYGIGLSDKAVFDTRNLDIRRDNTKKGAGLPIFIVKSYHSFFSQFEVIERLKYTLHYIDSKGNSAEFSPATWNGEYNEDNWNDEHLSRFISNNEVISYKKHQLKGDSHKQKSLNAFLDTNNPDNSSLSITDFYKVSKTPKLVQRLLNDWRYWLFPLLFIGFFVSFAINYRWVSVGLILTAVLIFVLSQLSRYEWSGFQNKRGWDWLALLIVPIVLAVAVNFVQNDAAERQKVSDLSRSQQQLMLEYFKNVKDIVLKEKKDMELNQEGSNPNMQINQENLSPQAKKLIASFTKVLVPNINGVQKRQVIDFLYDLGMIKCEGEPQDGVSRVQSCGEVRYSSSKNNQKFSDNLINLSEVNFENVDLREMQLPNLYLPKVNLNGANFTKSNLDGADLTDSSLNKANFDWASLRNASFVSPNISSNNYYPSQGKNYLLKLFLSLLPNQPVKCVLPSSKLRDIQRYQSYDRDYGREKEDVKYNFRSVKDYVPNVDDDGLKERLLVFSKDAVYKNYQKCFSRLKLENLYLKDADFRGFDLRGTSFKNSYLAGAKINGANLEGTNLEGAYLKDIQIDNKDVEKLDEKTKLAIKLSISNNGDPLEVIISELKKNKGLIDLTNLDLSTITIIGKDQTKKTELKSLNFKNARLVNSTLQNLDMGCDLQPSTNTTNNSQEECKSANLESIDLRNAKLTNIDLTGANLNSAFLMNTEMNGVILKKADLFAANLTGAIINDTNFEGANFNSVTLKGAKLENIKNLNKVTDFYAVDLSGAILNKVDLSSFNLNEADLSNANLAGAILYGADLSKAKNLDKVTTFKGASYCDKPSNNDTSPITKFPKKFNPKEKGMVVSCQSPNS
jgi:uncharacterized protein YjbI with pentapeptide repeats